MTRPTTKDLAAVQDLLDKAEATIERQTATIEAQDHALWLARVALKKHDLWCGHNADAPGDNSVNLASEALDAWWLTQSG